MPYVFVFFFKLPSYWKTVSFSAFKAVFGADISAEPDTGADKQWRNTSQFHMQLSTATSRENLRFESCLK